MQQLLIPLQRAMLLGKDHVLEDLSARLACNIKLVDENEIVIEGGAFEEYAAASVLQAFGRGFDIETAMKLNSDNYFFKSIDLKMLFSNAKQITRMKARLIGAEGKTKKYIQAVSGASIVVYGNTISAIGTTTQLRIAYSAIDVLLAGGTHKKAYRIMEREKKRSYYG
ncbi:MAG: hypothetical protein QXS17_02310 [Candidatus Micrarchaeaceae archaeon]